MAANGFTQSQYSPSLYHHQQWGLRVLVHGDDFVSTGTVRAAQWFKRALEQRFEIKTSVVGSGPNEVREARVLGRIVRITPSGWEYEADQRHGEILVHELGLVNARPVSYPWESGMADQDSDGEELVGRDATSFRALAARANYLAQDRGDISFATKEVCRHMAHPTRGAMRRLKRLGRYLLGHPRVVWKFEWQPLQRCLTSYSDSDWAGCRETARSTTGGLVMMGTHPLKSWCVTQKHVTLSSAEAELMAIVRCASECIGMTQLAQTWALDLQAEIYADSSAALAICKRQGCGRLRHVRIGHLWIQERVRAQELTLRKILGEVNPADLLTKV